MIDRHWPGHPPLFLCGCSSGEGMDCLVLRDDPVDWAGITLSAVEDLCARGFSYCYLILDDHPPLGACSEEHLNHTLPELMERMSAATINLYGWDQRAPSQGSILGPDTYYMQKQDSEFLWQFSLHPALWSLEALRDLLRELAKSNDPAMRSPWAFERRSGEQGFDLPSSCRNNSFRVCGLRMLGGRWRLWRRASRRLEFRIIDLTRWLIRLAVGAKSIERIDAALASEYGFFDGPYPLYWSGLMRKGRVNSELVDFLSSRLRYGYLNRVHAIFQGHDNRIN